jgi:hypothetical protein
MGLDQHREQIEALELPDARAPQVSPAAPGALA